MYLTATRSTIAKRFQSHEGLANGVYLGGRLAWFPNPPVAFTITLRTPVPLDEDLEVLEHSSSTELRCNGELLPRVGVILRPRPPLLRLDVALPPRIRPIT